MLRLKLQRIGKKKQAFFRLIVQEKARDPHDKNAEILGWYNPYTKAKELKKERIAYWLSQGAEPTDTLHNLFVDEGLITDKKEKTFKISKKRKEKIAEKNKKAIEASAMKESAPAEEKAVAVEETPVEVAPVPEVSEEKKEEQASVEAAPAVEEKPATDAPTEEKLAE